MWLKQLPPPQIRGTHLRDLPYFLKNFCPYCTSIFISIDASQIVVLWTMRCISLLWRHKHQLYTVCFLWAKTDLIWIAIALFANITQLPSSHHFIRWELFLSLLSTGNCNGFLGCFCVVWRHFTIEKMLKPWWSAWLRKNLAALSPHFPINSSKIGHSCRRWLSWLERLPSSTQMLWRLWVRIPLLLLLLLGLMATGVLWPAYNLRAKLAP